MCVINFNVTQIKELYDDTRVDIIVSVTCRSLSQVTTHECTMVAFCMVKIFTYEDLHSLMHISVCVRVSA